MIDVSQMTFDHLLQQLLATVPNKYDKRPSSMIYNALAPAAQELALLYQAISEIYQNTFAETAKGDYLELRTKEQGITRNPPVAAVRKGEFTSSSDKPVELRSGLRFKTIDGDNSVIFRVAKFLAQDENVYSYELLCETTGTIGNNYIGELLPVDNISGLATATLTDIIVPGEETEDDESLFKRYLERLNAKNFGGNIADYLLWMHQQEGVGAVKVFPTWQGGGTVKLTFLDTNYNIPSAELVSRIQEAIDPEPVQGQGVGLAPIGHVVTVKAADGHLINISANLTLDSGITVGQIAQDAKAALEALFLEFKQDWEDQSIIVRIAYIEARLLAISGVVDISQTTINGQMENISLDQEAIPIIGEVVFNGTTI